jgi:hypothetical protein
MKCAKSGLIFYSVNIIVPYFENVKNASSMPSSGLWRHVGVVRTDILEECVISIFRVEKISKLTLFLTR